MSATPEPTVDIDAMVASALAAAKGLARLGIPPDELEAKVRALVEAAEWTAERLDRVNGVPCHYCHAADYDGVVGIVHHEDCGLRLIRAALAPFARLEEKGD